MQKRQYGGTAYMDGQLQALREILTVLRVGAPNPHIVQGSTVLWISSRIHPLLSPPIFSAKWFTWNWFYIQLQVGVDWPKLISVWHSPNKWVLSKYMMWSSPIIMNLRRFVETARSKIFSSLPGLILWECMVWNYCSYFWHHEERQPEDKFWGRRKTDLYDDRAGTLMMSWISGSNYA